MVRKRGSRGRGRRGALAPPPLPTGNRAGPTPLPPQPLPPAPPSLAPSAWPLPGATTRNTAQPGAALGAGPGPAAEKAPAASAPEAPTPAWATVAQNPYKEPAEGEAQSHQQARMLEKPVGRFVLRAPPAPSGEFSSVSRAVPAPVPAQIQPRPRQRPPFGPPARPTGPTSPPPTNAPTAPRAMREALAARNRGRSFPAPPAMRASPAKQQEEELAQMQRRLRQLGLADSPFVPKTPAHLAKHKSDVRLVAAKTGLRKLQVAKLAQEAQRFAEGQQEVADAVVRRAYDVAHPRDGLSTVLAQPSCFNDLGEQSGEGHGALAAWPTPGEYREHRANREKNGADDISVFPVPRTSRAVEGGYLVKEVTPDRRDWITAEERRALKAEPAEEIDPSELHDGLRELLADIDDFVNEADFADIAKKAHEVAAGATPPSK